MPGVPTEWQSLAVRLNRDSLDVGLHLIDEEDEPVGDWGWVRSSAAMAISGAILFASSLCLVSISDLTKNTGTWACVWGPAAIGCLQFACAMASGDA